MIKYRRDILFWLAGLTLVSSVASYTTPNLCQRDELHLVIVMTCQFQRMNWDMIRNIFTFFKPTDSENATRKVTVTLVDMLSLNNMTLSVSNINNVSEICQVEDYDESISIENVLKLQTYILGNDNNSSKLFILYIVTNSYPIYNNFVGSVLFKLKFINYFIINVLNVEFDCCEPNSFPDILEVHIQDDLKYNNEFSLKLCSRCLDGWFPVLDAFNNSFITSCILFEEKRNLISWQYAVNYCKQKRSHLFTFETSLDFDFSNSSLKMSIKNFTKHNFEPNDSNSIIIYLGMYTLKAGNNEQLLWVNKRKRNSLIYLKVKKNNFLNTTKVCFAWNYKSLQNEEIFQLECTAKITKYVLCEQKFNKKKSHQSTSINHSVIQRYKVPNINFIIKNNTIISVSYVKKLNIVTFPTFVCNKYFSLSYNYVCDGIKDCSNGEDEQVCTYEYEFLNFCLTMNKFFCPDPNLHKRKCISKSQVCDMIEDCPDGSDESNCDDCILTQCSPNVCIPDHWILNCSTLNNLRINETSNSMSLININVSHLNVYKLSEFITLCSQTSQENNNKKFIKISQYNSLWTPKCIYMRDRHSSTIGCSDLSHLSNCTEFICLEVFFKCRNSYCIPDTYVLDGVLDCPLGEDEDKNNNYRGLDFICHANSKKIHPIYICDGKPDCPRGDDEINCISPVCPSGFICLDGTVSVNNTNILLNMSSFSPTTTFLNISGIDVSRSGNIMNILILKRLLVFIASRCNINEKTQINAKNGLVYHLDISYNDISKFTYTDFILQFSNLRFLNVSYNDNLSVIPKFYFLRLVHLVLLDLSFTKIARIRLNFNDKLRFINFSVTNLKKVVLSKFAKYEVIDFRKTRISDEIKEKFFDNITVTGKVLADYKLCCSYFRGEKLLAYQCEAEEQTLSTCEDLIGDFLKRVLLWVVAICAVFGNMIALGYRILFERSTLHLTYVLFVTCLSVSDLLMGIYLVIIASVDVVYRDVYILHENYWKQSTLCQIAGTLATMSSETSTFFILLITLERFLTIRFPFGEFKISNVSKYILIAVAWGLGVFLSLVPIIYPEMSLYATSETCLAFPLRKSNGIAWAYSVTVFLFFNSILFVVIAIGQFLIFMTISQHSSKFKTESQASARRADNISVALKLSVVVLSNFICWFPVCVMGIQTVVSDYEVTRETYAWIIALVLPINSALNPVLYTLPRISNSWTNFKRRKSSQFSRSQEK